MSLIRRLVPFFKGGSYVVIHISLPLPLGAISIGLSPPWIMMSRVTRYLGLVDGRVALQSDWLCRTESESWIIARDVIEMDPNDFCFDPFLLQPESIQHVLLIYLPITDSVIWDYLVIHFIWSSAKSEVRCQDEQRESKSGNNMPFTVFLDYE